MSFLPINKKFPVTYPEVSYIWTGSFLPVWMAEWRRKILRLWQSQSNTKISKISEKIFYLIFLSKKIAKIILKLTFLTNV